MGQSSGVDMLDEDRTGWMELKSKVALVTGGTRGLGAAIVKRLSLEGCEVVSCARRIPKVAGGYAQAADSLPLVFEADVSQQAGATGLVQLVRERLGVPDILVNNVGYCGTTAKAWETPTDEFASSWAGNVMSAVWLTRLLLPEMLKRDRGIIVYISSQAGKRAVPRLAAYSASKFALMGFTQVVAKEIEGSCVKSLTICPAGMNTSMREAVFGDAANQQSPDAVAKTIVDVLSNTVEVPHGAEIIIRGGKIVHVERPRDY